MIKKYLPLLTILIGVIMVLYGGYRRVYPRPCDWIETYAKVEQIDTINKKIDNVDKSRIIVKYSYKVGSITFNGVFLDKWDNNVKESTDKLVKEKVLKIYFNSNNPNLSVTYRPIQGIYRMAFGMVLVLLGILFYFGEVRDVNSSKNTIKLPIKIPNIDINSEIDSPLKAIEKQNK